MECGLCTAQSTPLPRDLGLSLLALTRFVNACVSRGVYSFVCVQVHLYVHINLNGGEQPRLSLRNIIYLFLDRVSRGPGTYQLSYTRWPGQQAQGILLSPSQC